MFHSFVDFKRK